MLFQSSFFSFVSRLEEHVSAALSMKEWSGVEWLENWRDNADSRLSSRDSCVANLGISYRFGHTKPRTMNIATARPDDLDEILPYLNRAFGFAPGSSRTFENRLPSQWSADCVDWDGVFIVRGADGRINSLVRVWTLNLILDGRPIQSGGIGSVSTADYARGQGAMSALMAHATQWMKQRALPLAILWGDRFRYANFGYETAGRALQWDVKTRGLKHRQIEPLAPAAFDDAVAQRISEARARQPYHRERTECEWRHIYNSPSRRVVASNADLGDGDFGWLVLESGAIAEWGGDAQTVLRLAAWTAHEMGAEKWSFMAPAGIEVDAPIRAASSSWSMHTAWCRAQILDLPATLNALDCVELEAELSALDPLERVWRLFGAPDAPRNIWMAPIDMI